MTNSTLSAPRTKPNKPRPDFPLFAHASGKWAKQIRGKLYYFGRWDDPHGAEDEYLAVAEDLPAGRTPQPRDGTGGIRLKDVCNRFMATKQTKLDGGHLSPRTFIDADRSRKTILDVLGANRCVADLRPSDFEKLCKAFVAKGYSTATLKNEITSVKSLFKYAYEAVGFFRFPGQSSVLLFEGVFGFKLVW